MRSIFVLVIALNTGTLNAEPLGLPPVLMPPDNPQTPTKITLGKALFQDTRFSADGTVSCASCHLPSKAFTDGRRVAQGIRKLEGPRNAPTVVNVAFYTTFFVDGRRRSLEEQALDPFVNPIEHGLEDHRVILRVVREDTAYPEQFQNAFDVAHEEITIEHVAMAIASFERTLISGDSPFDRYVFGYDKTAMTESAIRGYRLFKRKGNCANCHEIGWQSAIFTDNQFYNLGVGFEGVEGSLSNYIKELRAAGSERRKARNDILTETQRAELGRFNVTHIVSDIGRFKTPALRNVEVTAPYMHDGGLKTLEEIIEFYDQGGIENPYLDKGIFPLRLTAREKGDLVAFLRALTSPEYATGSMR